MLAMSAVLPAKLPDLSSGDEPDRKPDRELDLETVDESDDGSRFALVRTRAIPLIDQMHSLFFYRKMRLASSRRSMCPPRSGRPSSFSRLSTCPPQTWRCRTSLTCGDTQSPPSQNVSDGAKR